MIKKLKELVLSPQRFFTTIDSEMDLKKSLVFAMLFGSLGLAFELFYAILWPSKFVLLTFGEKYKTILLLLIIFSPLIIVINTLLYSGLYYVFLWIAGARKGIKKIFQVICYSSGIYILNIVPFIGTIVSGIWVVVLIIIGSKRNQEISYIQAIGAFLAMIILLVIATIALKIY